MVDTITSALAFDRDDRDLVRPGNVAGNQRQLLVEPALEARRPEIDRLECRGIDHFAPTGLGCVPSGFHQVVGADVVVDVDLRVRRPPLPS
jgi:hypothetical protein